MNLHKDMILCIIQEKSLYSNIGATHLKKLKLSIDEWLMLMASESVFADELMIFALSQTFQHHMVIFTHNACWTTIGTDQPIKGSRLLEICQVHLVYIGMHMYAELKRRPLIPIKSTAITELPSSIPPRIDCSENNASLNCAIDLSTKPAELDNSDNDDSVINTSAYSKNTSPLHIQDTYSKTEKTAMMSDTPSEDLFTGKPVTYLDKQDACNSRVVIPGINIQKDNAASSQPASTLVQLPMTSSSVKGRNTELIDMPTMGINSTFDPELNSCISADSSVDTWSVNGTNNTITTSKVSSTDSILVSNHNYKCNKLDPYVDACLSGTLE